MIDLTGRTVLVTGASRGIGAVTARALAAAGARAVVHYAAHREGAEAVVEAIGDDRAVAVQGDLMHPDAARRLWEDAMAWTGRVDVLVNNAGVYEPAAPEAGDPEWRENWDRTLRINLVAAADLCREAVREWHDGTGGSSGGIIINVASRAAHRGDAPEYWSYAASKGGMIAMTKTIARAYAGQGIVAYAVAPGFVETDMALDYFERDPAARDRATGEIPMGDIAPAGEVANVICFLASGLARHATGSTVDINGASYVR